MKIKYFEKCSMVSVSMVSRILDEFNINWWLDQGSLLGIVRDSEFLPWDHDVDIGVWQIPEKSKYQLLELLREKFEYCYYDPLNNTIKVTFFDNKLKEHWWFDISFYRLEDNVALKKWTKSKKKYNVFYNNLLGVSVIFFLGLGAPSKSIKAKLTKLVSLPLILILQKLKSNENIANYILQIVEKHFCEYVEVECDAKYFSEIKQLKIGENILNVPIQSEQYLQLKYGNNWMIPKKAWNYLEEDGAVLSREKDL